MPSTRVLAKFGQVSLNAAPLAAGQRQGGLGFFCAAGWIIENILQTGGGSPGRLRWDNAVDSRDGGFGIVAQDTLPEVALLHEGGVWL